MTNGDPEGTISGSAGDFIFYPGGISRYANGFPFEYEKVIFGPSTNVSNNVLAVWNGTTEDHIQGYNNVTLDGNILQIDQVVGTEDIGLRLRNQAASNLVELLGRLTDPCLFKCYRKYQHCIERAAQYRGWC